LCSLTIAIRDYIAYNVVTEIKREEIKEMTRTEIAARIEKLEGMRFMLNMKDSWTIDDSKYDTDLANEIAKLRKEMEKI